MFRYSMSMQLVDFQKRIECCDTIQEAAENMGSLKEETYKPIPENVKAYDTLYQEYRILHDYFGRGENPVMKSLRRIQNLK